MKKNIGILPWIVFLLILAGCLEGCSRGNKQVHQKPLYTADDTIIVTNLVESYLNCLHENQFDAALNMLSEISHDSVMPISDSLRNILLNQFNYFPVLKYEKYSETWTDSDPILMSYNITFAEDPEGQVPYITKMVLQPIRKDGYWYLTVPKR